MLVFLLSYTCSFIILLQYAQQEIVEVEYDLEEVETLRKELAEFLCEDVTSFKLEECFKTFQTFCDRFRKAIEVSIGENAIISCSATEY
jgi:uncharacterized protein YydD (DUF2326 family)